LLTFRSFPRSLRTIHPGNPTVTARKEPLTSTNEFALDALDFQIIAQLQDNGRKPTSEIAAALGIPRTTVARRIDRLVQENVITIGVLANSARIGLPIYVIIEVCIEPNKLDAVVAAIAAFDEVRWIGVVSGRFDLLVETMFRSQAHLQHFLLQQFAKVEGITQMHTAHVLKVAKLAFDWEAMRRAGKGSEVPESDLRATGDSRIGRNGSVRSVS